MQVSSNIVYGPKSNDYGLVVGIWVIVCFRQPSHHFLQTIRPLRYACLRLCSAVGHFIRNNCVLSAEADQRMRLPRWLHY